MWAMVTFICWFSLMRPARKRRKKSTESTIVSCKGPFRWRALVQVRGCEREKEEVKKEMRVSIECLAHSFHNTGEHGIGTGKKVKIIYLSECSAIFLLLLLPSYFQSKKKKKSRSSSFIIMSASTDHFSSPSL